VPIGVGELHHGAGDGLARCIIDDPLNDAAPIGRLGCRLGRHCNGPECNAESKTSRQFPEHVFLLMVFSRGIIDEVSMKQIA
jgi:hypothetical protein